jgi:uncharacterized protein YyaL (SSP411 family)
MADPPSGRRLRGASSAYLHSAAEQPIDWHPWGDEPFRLARESGRPILLDIGASWCHWCHVMDEGTYADPEVARLLADGFVAVKVDRDEHPEIDRRYQRQVNALTGEGGWPLTAFLTADGTVFLGGTYFPPTDGHGRPGFRRVLSEVARVYRDEPTKVAQNTRALSDALARIGRRGAAAPVELERFVADVVGDLAAGFDPVHGGFGGAPKFPHPAAVELLLWAEHRGFTGTESKAEETLARMADGGMYDQVGGGFHRYSVDEAWHIPHFEKMGLDNAELLLAYVAGVQRFASPRFEEVVRGTVGWAEEVLGDPRGGWAASQDADNAPGDDGDYFTWTRAELRGVLDGDEYTFASRLFGVDTDGRMPHSPERNVLFRNVAPEEAAAGLKVGGPAEALGRVTAALRAARGRRPTPTVDRALYTSINGRFIAAFARAGRALGEPAWVDRASKTADRFLGAAGDLSRGIGHRLEQDRSLGFGLLDDQASFALGLVELAGATARSEYVDAAVALLRVVDREFRGEDGLLREIAPSLYDGPKVAGLLDPTYPVEDMPHLSANATAALAFVRLGALVHDPEWKAKATALLAPVARRVAGAGLFAAGSALAAGLAATEPASVVVEGSDAQAAALVRAASRAYHPNAFVFATRPGPPFSVPSMPSDPPARSRALVCFGSACAPPVNSDDELRALLARGRPAG